MSLSRDVAALMRSVAGEVMLPRYRTLTAGEISEKSPGEIVTCVDREAEARLRDGLDRLGTGARVIGEEACAEDPALLDDAGRGLVWLVDPLDGTANFAHGDGPFGIMIALIADGDPVASWLLDPVSGRMCHAERGLGAWVDGRSARAAAPQGRPVAALATQFMAAHERTRVERAAAAFAQEPIPRCAAESYPRLVLGRNQLAVFQRILPWDHAAGVLFLTEAGGRATHWDGSPYRVGSGRPGLLAAASGPAWNAGMHALAPALATVGWHGAIAA